MKKHEDELVIFNAAEDYWLQKLKGVTLNPVFGDREYLDKSLTKTYNCWHEFFPIQLIQRLQVVSKDSDTNVFLIFLAAINILMYKYTGMTDILIATPGFPDEEEEAGVNDDVLLFYRTYVEGHHIPRDMINESLNELNDAYENHRFGYESFFKRFCDNKNGESEALSALGLQYNKINRESRYIETCDLLFKIEKNDSQIDFSIQYRVGIYREEQVAQLGRHFLNVLTAMIENLDRPVHTISLLTPTEQQKLAGDFAGKEVVYQPSEEIFLSIFERQAASTPQNPALAYENNVLSYRELDEHANRLARLLLKEAVLGTDALVPILMERSDRMVISIIAVWKCGAAYVPIDPSYPADRIETIIKDSGAKIIISETGMIPSDLEKTLAAFTKILYLDQVKEKLIAEDSTNLCTVTHPGDLAYVIYTSGSTGKPKGVMIEQRGMMNHLYAKLDELNIDSGSVIAQNASHCFDISIWQFFAALLKGGKTIVYANKVVLSPEIFIKQLGEQGVNILEVVPSYLAMMLDLMADPQLTGRFPALNYLLVTGESLKPGLVKRWFEKFPDIKMVNAYGPTEASDDITHFHIDGDTGAEQNSIPIGRTLRNFRIYILDAAMDLCPPGVKGEIYVSGIGVGRGYLNDITKTTNAFIKDCFLEKSGVRMYKTGDIGRYLPDGNIEFFGRKDYQVKVRGFRIELEEIENKLSIIPGIHNAVVIDREDKAGNTYLCAYITLTGLPGQIRGQAEIKSELSKTLPDYMVPSYIITLDKLPLTPNGKVDRKALPEPGEAGLDDYVAPRDEAEKKLAEIWCQVMGVERIGIHDNFFSLGGNSLLGIRIVNKIQEWLQETVHVTILFLAPTIAQLAEKLASYKIEKETRIGNTEIAEIRSLIEPLAPLPAHLNSAVKTPPVMFVLCPSRSGSTLLRVILAGHPKLFAPQEFELLSFNTLPERNEALSGKFGLYLEGVIRAIMELKNIDADEAKGIMEGFEAQGMTVREFYGILQSWLGERILVEKTPQYTYDMNVLRRAEEYFDSSLYIHLVRNPYAVIHSYENARLDQLFKYEHRFSSRELGELLWIICHQNILEFLETVPPARKFRLKYEEMVSNPPLVIGQMCRHFGLEFEPRMLDVYGDAGNRMTDGIYAESKMLGDVKFFTHSSIDTGSVEKWKTKYKTPFLGETAVELDKYFGYTWEQARYTKIEPVAIREHYQLSPSQKRLWILDRLEEEESHIAYNVPGAYWLTGNLNIEALEKAYETVIKRHEILRTTFINIDGEPRQKIHDFVSLGFKWEHIDLRDDKDRIEKAKILAGKEAASPFDLEHGPLLRTKTIRLEQDQYLFLFTMHHIISDGWSMNVLVKEILALYDAYQNDRENPLPPLQFQYRDYSEWLNGETMRRVLEKQEKYWLEEFAGEVPVLNLPLDYTRPAVMSFAGNAAGFGIDKEQTEALIRLARSEGVSIFIVLAAVFNVFLAKISGQEDIIIGTPTAGRHHPGLENILGMLVNTLALRSFPNGEMHFTQYLQQFRATVWEAFENQDYPFESLVEKVVIERDMGRNPLFDVMFSLKDAYEALSYQSLPGHEIKPYAAEHVTSKFDLSFIATEQEGSLYFSCEYCTKLFREETIQRFFEYLTNAAAAITQNPLLKISQIEIIPAEEKDHLLYAFNNTAAEYPEDKTIHQLFAEQAEKSPDCIAVVGGTAVETLRATSLHITYFQLNQQSNHMAGVLIEKGVLPDTIVGIMMERSIEMIIGILGILKSGGAYLPIDPEYPQERIQYMLQDSKAKIIVNNEFLKEAPQAPFLQHSAFITQHSNHLAYVIYTSGSTGRPKGVMVEHRSIFNTIYWRKQEYNLGVHDRTLQLFSFAFDGFLTSFFTPIVSGASVVQISSEKVKDIDYIKKIIVTMGITHFICVPSLYRMILEISTAAQLSCLKVVTLAGEQVPPDVLEKSKQLNPLLEIVNEYGPTEGSVVASVCRDIRPGGVISIGKPVANCGIYIIDKDEKLLPIGIPGQLVLFGKGLARGYLNNPELTADRFVKKHRSDGSYKTYINYKTGDLARWLPAGPPAGGASGGVIEFLGRIDQQVKIRGFRIELGEIEAQILKYPGIKEAVVLAQEEREDKSLCAYIICTRELVTAGLRENLAKELPDYMIPSYFVQMEKIPLTANGKIDRGALPKPGLTAGENYTAPRDTIEKELVDLWAGILSRDGAHASQLQTSIGIDDNFFQLGGHSLKATILISRIHKKFNVKVPLAEIFRAPVIRELAKYIREKNKEFHISIEPVEKKEYYPLSSAQKRLYFLQQMDINSTSYNMLMIVSLGKDIQEDKLKFAFNQLIIRHESLRTSFQRLNDEVVQRIHENVAFEMEKLDGRGAPPWSPAIIKSFIRPFDLSQAPLMRSGLIKLPDGNYVWLVDIHHIVSDGTSHTILTEDFMRLYESGVPLEPLPLQYKDFAQWQNRLFAGGGIKSQEDYWLQLYAGEIPRLNLAADYKRPAVFTFKGDHYIFELSRGEAANIKAVGAHYGGTLYMNMLAVLNILFYKYSNQTDIIIGSGIAGRRHADIQEVVGMFVNTLAMRNYPSGEKSYEKFLQEVIAASIKSFENQDVQFEELVEKLDQERDISRNPLFDIFMLVQNFREVKSMSSFEKLLADDGNSPAATYKNLSSKFDMTFFVHENGDEVFIDIEYYTGIFRQETIQRMVSHFKHIIKSVLKEPGIQLKDIEIIPVEEKQQLLYEFNDTGWEYPREKSIIDLFEEQVDRIPGSIALIGSTSLRHQYQITYRQMNEQSNRLANYLHYGNHVQQGQPVGIMMDRSQEMVAAIFGILKAGCAYVPISPLYPLERIKKMVNDAGIRILISQKEYIKNLNRLQWECGDNLEIFLSVNSCDAYGDEEAEENQLMSRKLWDYVGETAVDEVTGGGWTSSYTGELFTKEEMDEYGDNILIKLEPLFHKEMRVLEIGIASGISMYRIAPQVGLYYGTDLSEVIIEKNRHRIIAEGYKNIKLLRAPAHEIDQIDEKDFDLIIINSVIQYFHGHNYLRNVLGKTFNLLRNQGYLFIGDIMDQDLKEDLIADLINFKCRGNSNYKTKTDWSEELFISRSFLEDLVWDFPEIDDIEFSRKIHTLENELTRFRYDALLKIDKNKKKSCRIKQGHRHKTAHDLRTLETFNTDNLKLCFDSNNLAYIIYTSGSTGIPKGAMVTHTSVVNLLCALQKQYPFSPDDTYLLKTSYTFDVSIAELFGWYMGGGRLAILEKDGEKDPIAIFDWIYRHHVTHINFVPSMFTVFLDFVTAKNKSRLTSLKYIFLAGEALLPTQVEKFMNLNTAISLENLYGPTEGTVYSSRYSLAGWHGMDTVPIGRPIPNIELYILNKYNCLQPIGVPGELHIAGTGTARGYLNDPELTNDRFVKKHRSYGSYKTYINYKTGDLARWLPAGGASGGVIEFMGRIDQQVKIRGFRIELEEIESRLSKHGDIKQAAVLIQEEEKGDKYLVAYVVSHAENATSGLQEYLAKDLPDYMIPSYFIQLEKIPLLPSGKIDRKALPLHKPGLNTSENYTAPRDEIETKLLRIWAAVLGRDESHTSQLQTSIGIDDNFFQLGGHSLKATILVSGIHKGLNVHVPLAEIFKRPTVRGLAEYIKGKVEEKYQSIEPVEKKEYYELSSAQKRIFFLRQLDPDGVAYNIPMIIFLPGDFQLEKLDDLFKKLIKRHDSLRTSFHLLNNGPVQKIHDEVEFEIEYLAAKNAKRREDVQHSAFSIQHFIRSFIRPFDLSQAPLMRAGLLKNNDGSYILLVDIHHIITDGTSQEVLKNDFMSLYRGEPLPSLRLQYKDFAQWQNGNKENDRIKRQELYWLKEFPDDIPVLAIPTDYPRPMMQSFAGNKIDFEIPAAETGLLHELALRSGATLFMVLAAVLNILLAKLSGREDIVIGTPVAGRRHADLEKIIGMFVNTLALRNFPHGEKTFPGFLEQFKDRTLAAFENQEYPFDDLVEKVVINRDMGRNPIFDVLFVLQNIRNVPDVPEVQSDEVIEKRTVEDDNITATLATKFDLEINGKEIGQGLEFAFGYGTKLFKKETIERFIIYFKRIVSLVVKESSIRIRDIEIISEEEKEQILFEFNDTAAEYPRDKTIHQLFAEQVQKTPDSIAVFGHGRHRRTRTNTDTNYVGAGPRVCPIYITNHQLNQQSNHLAGLLIEKGVLPDTIVAIMMERSVEMIIGLLGILKSGGAYLPIDPEYPQERIQYMLQDSKAKIIITNKSEIRISKSETNPNDQNTNDQNKNQHSGAVSVLNFENLNFEFVSCFGFRASNLFSSNLAYIIYTSGSTGKPKGVMVGHHSVVRLVKNTNYITFSSRDRLLPTGSSAFDITTFEIWGPLCNGVPLSLASKDVILNAEKLKEVLVKHDISILHLIPQLFNQLAANDIELFAGLRYFLVGGDKVSSLYINVLRQKYTHLTILHMYGPTENTTFSTFLPLERNYEFNIPIGNPIANTTAYIVDKFGHLQPMGVMGELYVGGEGIARGYLNNPELTFEKFILFPFPNFLTSSLPNFPLYRTGDLARWLPAGSPAGGTSGGGIEFLGRIDQQVKIRGFRIELGEIENRLLKHPGIKEAVVLAQEESGDKSLCAYIVPKSELVISELREYLAKELPDYMIPSYFVPLERIPLTPNGKIDRKALPKPELKAGDRYLAPRDDIEKRLVNLWSEVLDKQAQASIGVNDNFFQLGGHSLKATILISRIHKEFNVKVPLAEIFKAPTIKELAKYIKEKNKEFHISIEPVEKKEYYPLSSAQKRMYFLQQLELSSISYNMPLLLPLGERIEKDKLEFALKQLIVRHESLRTSFQDLNNEVVQRVHESVAFEIEYLAAKNAKGLEDVQHSAFIIQHFIHSFIRPFDLAQAPLMRSGLIEMPDGNHIWIVDIHHIVSDGASHMILTEDFMRLYETGVPLEPLPIQYKDFAQWQNRLFTGGGIKGQEDYWLQLYAGEIPRLNLAADFKRPVVFTFEGDQYGFRLEGEEAGKFKTLGARYGGTLYMNLMAALNTLFYKYTGQTDIIIGSGIAGRRHADIQGVVGMFINTLVMRNYPSGEKTYENFLKEVIANSVAGFENQDVQFEELVDKLELERDLSRNPLFDISIVVQNFSQAQGNIQLEIRNENNPGRLYQNKTAKFDLTFFVSEFQENVDIRIEYYTGIFKEETIQRLVNHFHYIIKAVIKNPAIAIKDIDILSEKEKEQLLYEFNDTNAVYPGDKTIHRLFAEQVQKTPDSIALVGADLRVCPVYITYHQLNEQSNHLAGVLSEKGVQADTIVAIIMERSIEMIIGILGILKSGGAYLPIDPDYPPERIDYMLKDSNAAILLTDEKEINCQCSIVNCQLSTNKCPRGGLQHSIFHAFSVRAFTHSNHLCYIIYTSGSTGNPKGVMVEHRSLINYAWWASRYYMKGEKLNFPFYTSISFDLTVTSVFLPLMTGNSVILYGGQNTPIETIADIINDNRIGIMKLTPAHLKIIKEITLRNTCTIKRFILGGENLDSVLAADIYKKFNGGIEIYNEYGPTEATVGCMIYRYSPEKDQRASVPIGAPADNVKIYLLDKYGYPVATGVIGEIYIGGDGIARGYLNRPELTAEKFDQDLWDKKDDQDKNGALRALNGCPRRGLQHSAFRIPHSNLYCTGDLARWLSDGNIEFLGRIDHQVKIRGFRIELGEIANCLLKISGVKEAVVLVQGEDRDDKYLCAYFVSDRTWEIQGLRETLAGELPDYMIPSYFVQVDKIPLTSNGKVDRGALLNLKGKSPEEDFDYTLPANDVEKKLVEIWQKVLGKDKISTNDNFFMTGGDSIKAIQIISRMSSAGYKVEMKDIFQYPVISGLAPRVKKLKRIPDQSTITGAVPLTPIQARFFNEPRIDVHHYNQAVILFSREGFDKEAIKAVFAKIQEHHDALRMTYKLAIDSGKMFQMAHGFDYPLSIDEYDLKKHGHSLDEFLRKVNLIQAGINLEKGPLMKLGLFHLDDGDRLLIVIHHLVIDGVSWRILFEDFETLYGQYKQGKKLVLPPKTDSFKRWSEQLSKYANSREFLKEKTYWQKIESFDAQPIPKDFDEDNTNIGDTVGASFTLEEKETELLLTKVNRAFRTEINDILLTAFAAAIKKTFGSNPVCIALEGHGREEILADMDIGRTVGWFTSLYPVVLDVSYTNDLGRQVKEVKETLRQIPNKGIGYGILRYLTEAANKNELEFKLKPQISFNYLGQFDADVKQKSFFEISRESVGNSQNLNNKQEYILNISGMAANSRLTMNISYNKLHFKPGTMAQLTGNFESELKSIIAFCSSQETVVPTPADFTYKGLAIEIIDRLVKEYPEIQDLYTLSPMQEGMLFHTLLDDSSASYHEQMSYRLEGELDIPVVEKSLNELFKRHDILRTAFVHQDIVRPVQIVLNERTIDFYYEDLCRISDPGEKENHIREFKAKEKYRPFNLSKDALMRVAIFKLDESGYEFIWSFHHILMDGWCTGILNTEFFEIYSGYAANQPLRLPGVIPYREYIQWLEKNDKEDSARYWKNYLDSFEEPTGVPKTKPARELKAVEIEMVSALLDMEKTALLNKLAGRNNVTVNTVIQAVWGILLGKYNGKEDVVFGAVVSGRPSELAGVESIIGLFINTIPVRIRWHGKMKFNHMIHMIQKESLAGSRYHYHPLAEIQSAAALKQNLIDHIFIFENYPIAERIEGYGKENKISLKLTNIEVFEQTNYDFNLVLAGSNQFRIIFHYNSNAYDREFIERLAQHFSIMLDQVLKDPGMETGGLTLLSEEEKNRVLYEFNDTAAEYPKDKTIHQLFAEQAEKSPDSIAVFGHGRHRRTRTNTDTNYVGADLRVCPVYITYHQLNEQSDRLAGVLIEKGVLPDTIVAIMMERSIEMIIGLLGILKSGGAYLPIDPDYPPERIDYMLKDSNAKVTVNSEFLMNVPQAPFLQHSAFSVRAFTHSNLAYIIYTSGSTGKPKGVLITHRSFVNLIYFHRSIFEENQDSRMSQVANPAFDAMAFEVWPCLLSGASLYIIDNKNRLDPVKTRDWLIRHCITISFQPTVMAEHLLTEIWPGEGVALKSLCAAGDKLNHYPQREYPFKLYNLYGPTEDTVWTTWTLVEKESVPGRAPVIGKPIANHHVYILDTNLNLQPVGLPGELCITGIGLAQGYLNNPELTAGKFISVPSVPSVSSVASVASVAKIYKTGDLAKWLPDGNIEFLGRIDQQVKIRGFRIELGEIENRLEKHPGIKEVVVVVKESDGGEKYLCAYFIPSQAAENIPSNSGLKEYLSLILPAYMIPTHFIALERIPLTPSGKLDRKALPGPADSASSPGYTAPANEIEEKLTQIWANILGIEKEKISTHENFFELGGTSMGLIRQISLIYKEFEYEATANQIYLNPTIQAIAKSIISKKYVDEPVVLLNQPGQKILFFFPPGAGFGVSYQALANIMNDYSIYSFNFIEDENRLNQYVEIITAIQKTGPYVLAGWSAAGKLVFEVAGMLEHHNREVSDIIMVDSLLRENITTDEEKLAEMRSELIQDVQEALEEQGVEFVLEEVKKKAKKYTNYISHTGELGVIHARVHLILSENMQNNPKIDITCWDKRTANRVEIYNGFGSHSEMLIQGLPLEKNAELIKNILDRL